MVRDGHVRLLPLHVANKIAAGEVVERPASVLKELLENAIDAGARRIEAQVVAGGRKLVSVRDDGCGMTREDALMSLERQATSKIRDVDDIERIDTFGFRGEAIPSIAAVSRFTLVTRRAEADEATRLVVNAGTVAEVAACGAPPGTCVEVRDLFCNVPARRKFLRAYATEEAHVKATFVRTALAHPQIGLALSIDGRETFNLAPGATLEERVHALFGAEFAESLVAVESSDAANPVRVGGYVERPGASLAVRHEQYVFTNGRPATAAVVASAFKDGYPRRPGDERPGAILFIDLPPEQVDVNVHPAKREVRFRRPADVRAAILSALENAFAGKCSSVRVLECSSEKSQQSQLSNTRTLQHPNTSSNSNTQTLEHSNTPTLEHSNSPSFLPPFTAPVQPSFDLSGGECSNVGVLECSSDKSSSPNTLPNSNAQTLEHSNTISNSNTSPDSPQLEHSNTRTLEHLHSGLRASEGPWRWFKYLATTASGYLLLETDAGVVTVNPAAARERIVYEAMLDVSRVASQPLLIPETVHLSPTDSARLKGFVDVLAAQGFTLDDLGGDNWKIDAVPQILGGVAPASVLSSIVYDVRESGARRGSARWREELVAKSVARSWAGASPKLTEDGATRLVEELAACRMPYVDPRGKPVMIFTSNNELSRKFAR